MALAASLAAALPAQAQSPWDARIERFEVPAECAGREAFAARLDALGATPGAVVLELEVARSWSGLLRGAVVMRGADGAPVERVIEDEVCADVLDALAIATALLLREAPPGPPPAPPDPPAAPVPDPAPAVEPPAARPHVDRGPRVVVALGAGLRVGLGPVPGVAVAPEISLAVEVDRFFVALHALGWPEAAAPPGTGGAAPSPGVALYAVGGALEVGARLGDELSVVPAAALELGAVVGRGLGVERARTDVALACDAGLAVTGLLDLGALRLWVRADLLFAVAQPVYVVAGIAAHEAPAVRGTGMIGLSYLFGT